MSDNPLPQVPSRRRFIGVAAAVIAAGSLSQRAFAETNQAITEVDPATGGDKTAIRPLRVNVPESQLIDLRRRIKLTRWPDRETVTDDSQGIPARDDSGTRAPLVDRLRLAQVRGEAESLPNFVTEIDGLDIHFIHVRSKHESAMPLIVTHGWPGSVIEQLKIIDPLTNPTAYGASASDAFHLVIPSCRAMDFPASPPRPAGALSAPRVPGSR